MAADDSRPLTVRLSAEMAEDIETIAKVCGTSIAEEIRTAVANYIAARRTDPEFAERLRRAKERSRRALERLGA